MPELIYDIVMAIGCGLGAAIYWLITTVGGAVTDFMCWIWQIG